MRRAGEEGPCQMIPVISWKDLGSAAEQKGETDETLKGRCRKGCRRPGSVYSHPQPATDWTECFLVENIIQGQCRLEGSAVIKLVLCIIINNT